MIKIMLKDGQLVVVPTGLAATFQTTTRNVYHDEVVETTLDVKNEAGYGGKVVASFKASEVIGFTVETEDTEEGGN